MDDSHHTIGSDEEIIINLNDHWFVLVAPCFFYLIGWVMGIATWLLSTLFENPIISASLITFGLFIITLNNHLFFGHLFKWEVSAWIVTSKRIISFEFIPLKKIDADYIEIKSIHEMQSIRHGLLKHIFSYGEVVISPIASTPITLKYVPHPDRFVQLIETILNTDNPKELDATSLQKLF